MLITNLTYQFLLPLPCKDLNPRPYVALQSSILPLNHHRHRNRITVTVIVAIYTKAVFQQ